MTSATAKLESLEGLRFLSSLAIVASHYVPYVSNSGWTGKFYLAVDLFFVISGIVIAHGYAGRINNRSDYGRFMLRRFARLYPLHLATFAFYAAVGLLALQGLLQVDNMGKYDFSLTLPNLLMTHAWAPDGRISFNYVSWSISAEMFVYLLFPLLALLMRNSGIRSLFLVVAAAAGAAALSHWLWAEPFTKRTWDFGIVRALPSFMFGLWLHVYARDWLERAPAPAWRLSMLICSLLVAALVLLRAHDYLILPLIWLAVASAYACDMLGQRTYAAWGPLSRRGELTYSIYMLHTVVATVVIAFLGPRLLGGGHAAAAATVLTACAVLYVISVISLRWFEQPVRGWINSWGRPHPAEQVR